MDLSTIWFCLIVVLWLGYLFLEGFDFGVGILLGLLARDNTERRVMVNTIGPVWDGNEVWVLVAVGATFAAFPPWYATMLSTAYLPVLLILLALIGRGVAFEYRGKVDSARWRRRWDVVIQLGSWIPPLGWGLVLTAMATGLPLTKDGALSGGPLALFTPLALLGALAVAGFSILHGSVFLALKTEGEIRQRAGGFALRIGPLCLVPIAVLLVLLQVRQGSAWTLVLAAVALLAGVLALVRLRAGREGQSFALLGVLLVGVVVVLFGSAFPAVIPSTLDPAYSLTVANSASSPYTLGVMTWVAAFGTPAVLLYQSWTYWVFRRRIGTKHIPEVHVP
ncbi:cytochrome d ubiquinol oxidase subunit II [Kutzneria viridogrisea]|uniref:Cytochrome d ubiquinol oxidase subunit 2 n=2 Tax=Kutzneria TaxID=43356 RepID=W5VXD3_9PSEU|nr:cytochrome d ubiquinol oxidase subunit II [Kutzneria albida]AHH93503.1 Cytochrome d ubiquinol oxidase subunit 2 [Kutzneria albida DSM 43870]MBA8929111.1 cytochrome d ubiquinol oxidase subunit II [Kutzneria viridogrisea]